MKLRLGLAASIAALLATGIPTGTAGSSEAAVGTKTLFDCGDCWPAAFTFTPDGKQIFYLERYTGEIHRYTIKSDKDTRWGAVGPVDGDGERGALGIAV